MGRKEQNQTDSGSFEADVAAVLMRLRSALAELIGAVPDDIAKGADLHRAFHIDRKLSWKVFKIASAADPVAAGSLVPSRSNMNTFIRAARKRGISELLIESVTQAAAEFEDLVSLHAGDRATFDSMVSALGDKAAAEQIDLAHRRLAFRGLRHIYGVQARTQMKCAVIQPSDKEGYVDFARIEGLIDLRQLRGDAPLIISRSEVRNDDGTPINIVREPLDPTPSSYRLSLLREFCSKPLPEYREVDTGPGGVDTELLSKGVGKRAAVTCVEGHIVRNAFPRYRERLNQECANTARVLTPCEVLLIDIILREDTYDRIEPRAVAYSERLGPVPALDLMRDSDKLPIDQSVVYLGKGPSVLHTPDVPRYAQLGRYVFDKLGWDADRFDVYRYRVEYPVVPSEAMLIIDLPNAP